ncbi:MULTISPECIES: FAD-dependent oxidoreductase [unclassified Streptomyces]|uniref:FAD-dependent oxidoreductase n=1 Tax=unclassified Streptomyces TaxID=2593676 RepID=UPI002DD7FDB2|nr:MULTISPECIES: FAD-dependent oxidoreductase [unclassified Streptomyces]WSE00523.1 FAD-dependent oxidoreductase [Streptomyces sp. NBC_01474]
MPQTVSLDAVEAPVVQRSDVIVVGGGPAGVSAAVAAARTGASVTLLERYSALGGLASGGMVLVLDDMINGNEITVTGIVDEYVERMAKLGLAVYPPAEERYSSPEMWAKWGRWGAFDFHSHTNPKPICYAVAFDPDGWKRVSNDLVRESGVNLRLHSWFSRPVVQDGAVKGVVCETKSGPQAVMGDVVIDTTGDIDVASRAGASYAQDNYLVTLVFRLGGVDTATAERFEQENPREARAINRKIKRLLGGAWELWWLKTPVPGVVWCNAPHLTGFDGTDPVSLTEAEFEARARIGAVLDSIKSDLPGFKNAYLLDVAEQMGVRQTRLLQGEYVVTKDDVTSRRHFADSVSRGRDYYTPYRALLPRDVDQLLVAGRHYSATPEAQRMSREIPPCMAMGQAAGIAAATAVEQGVLVRDVDPAVIQRRMREQGADPGDVPAQNATVAESATVDQTEEAVA